MISRIIKVEVGVISRCRRLRPLPRPWLFWISQKSNIIIVLLYIERNKKSHVFASSRTASTTKRANLETMHRGHTCHDYPWPWVSLTWLVYNLQLWRDMRWFRKYTVRIRPIRKEIVSSMCNNRQNWTKRSPPINQNYDSANCLTTARAQDAFCHVHRHDVLTVPLTVLLHSPITSMMSALSYFKMLKSGCWQPITFEIFIIVLIIN